MAHLTKYRSLIGKALAVCALAGILAISAAGSAYAVGHDDDWRRHQSDAWRWHHAHPHPYAAGYVAEPVYSPPVIVAPPPPPPSGINLVVPLNFH